MQSIKFYKKYDTHLAKLGDVEYKGYNVGDLPNSFGFIYNKSRDQEGKSNWFNYYKIGISNNIELYLSSKNLVYWWSLIRVYPKKTIPYLFRLFSKKIRTR